MREWKKGRYGWLVLLLVAAVAAVVAFIAFRGEPQPEPKKLTYGEFISQVEAGQVENVTFAYNLPTINGKLKDDTAFVTDNLGTPDFKKFILEHGVEVLPPVEQASQSLWISIIPNLLTTALIAWVIIGASKRLANLRTNASVMPISVVTRCNTTFADVAGNEEAKENLSDLVDFFRNPIKYQRFGAKIPKGTILYGPPGTGKTLLARALAGTANVNFISVSGSDFVEKYVGIGASRVRQLFSVAKTKAPCIIFIDELDAVGKKRGDYGLNDERDQTLNQILIEMDGFTGGEGVIVMGATNRLDTLDHALLRSGRFDRHIRVDLPDLNAREAILKLHSANKPLNPEVDLHTVAKMTIGMSGADLANILNEASIYAAKQAHEGLLMSDIDRAINKLTVGEERQNRSSVSEHDKIIAAYHEAGHAIMAKLYAGRSVPKVTIIPTTTGAGGYTLSTPEERMQTKEDMMKDIAFCLGGRAAEELFLGSDRVTGGASQDLVHATRIASRMVKELGMSEHVGLVNFEALGMQGAASFSGQLVLNETRSLIDSVYKSTLKFLENKRAIVQNLAKTLLAEETVYEKTLEAIVHGKDPGVIVVQEYLSDREALCGSVAAKGGTS